LHVRNDDDDEWCCFLLFFSAVVVVIIGRRAYSLNISVFLAALFAQVHRQWHRRVQAVSLCWMQVYSANDNCSVS